MGLEHLNLTVPDQQLAIRFYISGLGFTRDPYGGTRAGFSATTELNRGDFGISTNIPMDGGRLLVGDKIDITVAAQAVLQQEQ